MADPTIQTFCCYASNISNASLHILEEFNTNIYNGICLFSATMGILGAVYQILPRREYSRNHRWISFSAARGRKIIVWLAVSDLLASLGVLVRASLWLNYKGLMPAIDHGSSVIYCAVSSAWIQYFYTATWIWTLCYAIDMRFILCEKAEHLVRYHMVAWTAPAVLTSVGLSLLYVPDANCHISKGATDAILRVLPNYIATYIPIAIVMIACPCLYLFSCKDMEKIITCSSGQFTRREREIIDAVRIKFSAINIVFYVCWFPNLINGILLWALWFRLPITLVVITWYMMALINPLQALFNCLVYRRWNGESEMVVMPWTKDKESDESDIHLSLKYSSSTSEEEYFPLLRSFQRTSISKYTDCI